MLANNVVVLICAIYVFCSSCRHCYDDFLLKHVHICMSELNNAVNLHRLDGAGESRGFCFSKAAVVQPRLCMKFVYKCTKHLQALTSGFQLSDGNG